MGRNSLLVESISAWYGSSQALWDVSLEVNAGAVSALLGRNGAGKSTTLKAIMGLVDRSGEVSLANAPLEDLPPWQVAARGVRFVREDRAIFASLTVDENLRVAQKEGGVYSVEEVYDSFPRLYERRSNFGGTLSGGEQQILTICRALLAPTRVLLLDEPSEGLAPEWIRKIADLIQDIVAKDIGILLVEQRLDLCLDVASSVAILEEGRQVYAGTISDFTSSRTELERHLLIG